MWWLAVQAAVSYSQAADAKRKAETENAIRASEAELTNQTRKIANGRNYAVDSLNRWVQSVNNNLALRSGGEALNANTTNRLRTGDYRTQRAFSGSLREAESAGAASVARAASGVNGQVASMIGGTMALRNSIVKEQLRRQGVSEDDGMARQAGMIMSQMVTGLDNSILTPSTDYSSNTPSYLATKNPLLATLPYLLTAAKVGYDEYTQGTTDSTPLTAEQHSRFTGNSTLPNDGLGIDDPYSLWVSK